MDDDVIEELEDLDEASDKETDETSSCVSGIPDATGILSLPSLKPLVASYEYIPFPFALLDGNLEIVYKNCPLSEILGRFNYAQTGTFPSVFHRAFGDKAMHEVYEHLVSADKRFTWKGVVSLKSRESVSLVIKMSIFPFFLYESREDKPIAYTMLFDDLTEERQAMLRGMFMSLLEASKMKDNDTGKHIQRVNLYSHRMAEELFDNPAYPEVDMDFMNDIGFLAAMHDVGKIGTPDDILNKEGPLADWEWTIMQEHTKNGAYILSTYPNPMARGIALCHHEKWNGQGYPYRLEGSMIPLAARIVSLADVYDALRMVRSYKPAYDHDTSIAKMGEWRGVNFDPDLLDVFLRISGDMERIFAENADRPSS